MNKYWLEPYQEFIQYKKISEGLIKTHPIELFDKKLRKLLNKYEYQINIKDYGMIELFINFSVDDKIGLFKKIISLSNVLGYYITRVVNNNKVVDIPYFPKIKNFDDVIIYFAKNFDDEIVDKGVLYHLTLNDIWQKKIMKKGLKPKKSLMVVQNDKDKIYLSSNIDKDYIFEKVNDMKKSGLDNYYNIYDWVALKIIVTQNMKIFKDEKMNNSFYTLEPITMSSIIDVIKIK